MASPSTIITMGYGNGTLAGSPSLILTLGYGAGAASTAVYPIGSAVRDRRFFSAVADRKFFSAVKER